VVCPSGIRGNNRRGIHRRGRTDVLGLRHVAVVWNLCIKDRQMSAPKDRGEYGNHKRDVIKLLKWVNEYIKKYPVAHPFFIIGAIKGQQNDSLAENQ
jgi:hypothetical protein